MRRISFLLVFSLFFSSCAPGLMVTVCVSNPKKNNFSCYNPSNKKKMNQSPSQVDNWIFLSAADERSMLQACANKTTVKVKVCVFAASTLNFACFNEVNGQASGMTFADSENWIGVSPVDEELLLQFCVNH